MAAMDDVARQGIILLGCGKMGTALLDGWLAAGLPPASVHILDPVPHPGLAGRGLGINDTLPDAPAVILLAVKPQMMAAALPQVVRYGGGGTLVLSIAAGTPVAAFEAAFGRTTPIVRAMPNTPAAIGRGITAIVGNADAGPADLALAEALMGAVGPVVRLDHEDQMDAVTAVSGSGPAYVFHMIECLAAAGEAEGLPAALARHLATATVAGAGALAEATGEPPAQLRVNVTSPGGTTAAALVHLMDPATGLAPLMARAVSAAAARGRALRG